jgi:hypothetical protein
VSADGSKLSSKRVSKLSRRYHLHKKQLRQSAMMAKGLPDSAADDGGNDDDDRSGGQFDTSADAEFSLSTQPPSSGHRSTISVAMNHPAAAARRSKKPLPPRRESPGCTAKTIATVRGCTPVFSRAKAKIRVLVPRRQHTRNKIIRAGRATSHSPPTVYRRNHKDHFTLNRPLGYYYRPIAGASSWFWRRSGRGISLVRATAKPES